MSTRIRAISRALLLIPLVFLVGFALIVLGMDLRSGGLLIVALMLLGGGVPATLVHLLRALLSAASDLEARAAGLEPVSVVGGAFGPYLVRGRLGEHEVRVFRDRVLVEAEAGHLACGRSGLGQIARGLVPAFAGGSEAARELLALGVRTVSSDGRRVLVTGSQLPALEVVTLALELARAGMRVRVRPAIAGHGAGCPYCHAALGSVREEATVRCPGCDVRQHAECWKDHGGCAVHGCRRAPASRPEERAFRNGNRSPSRSAAT